MSSDGTDHQRVVILGALSTIAQALARRLAENGADLVLAGRNEERLHQIAADLRARARGRIIEWPVDLVTVRDSKSELAHMGAALGGSIDVIVLAYGRLGDQHLAETNSTDFEEIVDVNFTSAARWCLAAGSLLEEQRKGLLLALSSVAGDRGRRSNYIYGAAKAGLTVMMEGLAHRLAPIGAHAVVVKLGFVDTAMTAHIPKTGPLWAKPDAVARRLLAVLERPSKPVIYLPWFWRPIMGIIRRTPYSIFHKTKL